LAAMRLALSPNLLYGYNSGFLRGSAKLAVLSFSDEDDCGEPMDITETLSAGGNICYFASKGIGPEGETVAPDDPTQRPYRLTPVQDYYDFLLGVKGQQAGMVTFAAITGIVDAQDPSTTSIEYEQVGARWQVKPVCVMPACQVPMNYYCSAEPAIRYIQLAQMFHGMLDTICQEDFANSVLRVAGVTTGVRRVFDLRRPPNAPAAITVRVDSATTTAGWTYNPIRQAVDFDENSTPRSHSLVEVEYTTACP
jgi:hypothetical protein